MSSFLQLVAKVCVSAQATMKDEICRCGIVTQSVAATTNRSEPTNLECVQALMCNLDHTGRVLPVTRRGSEWLWILNMICALPLPSGVHTEYKVINRDAEMVCSVYRQDGGVVHQTSPVLRNALRTSVRTK